MQNGTKRRLTLLATGVALAAVTTALTQTLLIQQRVVDTEAYAVAVGLGVAIPLLLAAAYPRTGADAGCHAVLVVAEAAAAVVVGVGVVALLVETGLRAPFGVGAGAAATYIGGTAARAVVLGRKRAEERPVSDA